MAITKREKMLSAVRPVVLQNTHKLLLEALRHREQEIFRYLGILVPALGGFIWLLHAKGASEGVLVVGTLAVLLMLLMGTAYSLALGYNYRYITLQLAKLEKEFGISDFMLKGWPGSSEEFRDRYKIFCCIPWCTPPEIIKIFWLAFVLGLIGVTVATCSLKPSALLLSLVIPLGTVCTLIGGLVLPRHFGRKLHEKCKEEIDETTRDSI